MSLLLLFAGSDGGGAPPAILTANQALFVIAREKRELSEYRDKRGLPVRRDKRSLKQGR